MPRTLEPWKKTKMAQSFQKLIAPLKRVMEGIKSLASRGNRPLQMTFEDQLNALIFFHLEDHTSGRELIQTLKEDEYAKEHIAPDKGIEKSSFFEAVNSRGLEQSIQVFEGLVKEAQEILPQEYPELGELIGIDGSFIEATLSMAWADYRKKNNKAKVHIGFNINRAIPSKIFLTTGKEAERPFVDRIASKGQTAVTDRGYQCHKRFDKWQTEGIHFTCRIKKNTTKEVIRENIISSGSNVFYDAVVYLGTETHRTEKEVRVVAYRVDDKEYWIATDRYDLTGEQIALIYKLRWNIEVFFGWWKRHLKVYHLIARTHYGVMMQIMAGLITYILLAIYCHETHNEKVSIKRVRELRIKIRNEAREAADEESGTYNTGEGKAGKAYAKT